MRSLRRPAAVFIAVALAGGLAACGDDDEAATTTTTVAGSDAVDITMTDYAYAVSGNLKSGGTIRLANTGNEFHMIGLLKLKDGKTIEDVTALLEAEGGDEGGPTTTTADGSGAATTTTAATEGEGEEEEDPFAEIGEDVGAPGSFMGPGQEAEITVPGFGEGTYAMICFLPTEGGGPPHFAQGMIGELTVVGDEAAEPTADTTFKLEPGKPISGPSTLTAGRHVLKFEGVGDAGELEPGLAKLNTGATVADINRAFEAFETETDFVLPVNAASQIPGQLIVGIFDLLSADSVYVAVDLTPGTYGIDAHDSDVEDPPTDPVEKITFTVT